jgi:transcriptional regulator of arginine metabolism
VKGGAAGAYQAPLEAAPNGHSSKPSLQRALSEQLLGLQRVQQLVLLRTGLGHANSLCAVLDAARLPEVVGTLAGEDTILIITPDTRRARALVKRLEETAKG